jgi:membrane-bound serine protease (ClpP class)
MLEAHDPNGRRARLRYRLRPRSLIAGAALLSCGATLLIASGASAQERPGRRGILVVQVEGAIDPPNAELVTDAIERANDERLTMVILQVDSKSTLDTSVGALVAEIRHSRVPVVVWIGPAGAKARGGAVLLLEAAPVAFAAPGSDLGPAHPVRMDEPNASSVAQVRGDLARLASANGRDGDAAARLATRSVSPEEARDSGAIDGVRPTLGETIVTLDRRTVRTAAGDVRLSTAKVIGEGRDRRRQPNQEVVFDSLGIGAQVRHALLGPATAYFLFVVGLALIVFEFFAASVGFAAAVGAICVICAGYGFAGLPVRGWAIGLLLLASFGFAVDAQAGGLGPWTAIGVVSLGVGSVFLFGGDSALHPAWWIIGLVVIGTSLFYVFAIPSFIRSRFSTPTLGREGMIGEMGVATVAIAPDGVIEIRGARWRAHTNRATPIGGGDPVRVVAVQGVVLEVEPEAGGARDYRERARKRRRGDAAIADEPEGHDETS